MMSRMMSRGIGRSGPGLTILPMKPADAEHPGRPRLSAIPIRVRRAQGQEA